MLKNSDRNWSCWDSWILNVFWNTTSKLTKPGPRKLPMGELPQFLAKDCPGAKAGSANAAWLNQQSNVWWPGREHRKVVV